MLIVAKRCMQLSLCILALLSGAVTGHATELTTKQFSVLQTLYVRGNAAAYRLELPAVVFENTRHLDSEVAVFNAQGERVPSWIDPGQEVSGSDDMHWRRVEVNPLEQYQGYVVDVGGSFIVSQIRVRSRVDNTVAALDLYTSDLPHGPWRFQQHANLMQLSHEGRRIEDTLIYTGRLKQRYLKLDFVEGNVSFATKPPLVEIRYAPLDLIFLRYGEGPFTLAFGYPSDAPRLRQEASAQKPSQQFQSRDVVAGELHWQAAQQLEPKKVDTWDYGRMAFWLSLSVFVVVMLAVAMWLVRDVQRHGIKGGSDQSDG